MPIPWRIEQGFLAPFNLIGFILCYIPLAWQLEAWNVGCVLYIVWVGTSCLILFVNHVIWWDNYTILVPIWCDITNRFTFMASSGISAATLVIARRLCIITTGAAVRSVCRRDKYRSVAADLAIGLSVPIAQLIIFWFLQGGRYNIYESVGCYLDMPVTWLTIVLFSCWPIPIGLISAFYSVRTIIAYSKRRKEIRQLLASNNNLTFNRYFRILAVACTEIMCTVPITVALVVMDSTRPMYKYKGLADLHNGYDVVYHYPVEVWQEFIGQQAVIGIQQWLFIGCALVFFLIFGLTEEARRHYRSAYATVAMRTGIPIVTQATPEEVSSESSVRFHSAIGPESSHNQVSGLAEPAPAHDAKSVQRHLVSLSSPLQHDDEIDADVEAKSQVSSAELPFPNPKSVDMV